MASFVVILVLVTLTVPLVLGAPVCEKLKADELQNLKMCNLTSYSNTTYFWDKANCLRVDQQLVGLIESFSDSLWKNKVGYPTDCLEEFVRYTCSQACPVCEASLSKKASSYKASELDSIYKSTGRGLPTCNNRCESFTQQCATVPGLSKMVENSRCFDFTQASFSTVGAEEGVAQPPQLCTNHNSTFLKNHTEIGSPEALGYATCDAGYMSSFDRLICKLPSTQKASASIWNDRAGDEGVSTCMEKDHSLDSLLPQFVSTFESYSLCVEEYDTCLTAYSDFVCSLSCPYCKQDQIRAPCKSKCDAVVSACAGLPVLGITAKMDCSRYSNSNCTDMTTMNVDTIIEENSSDSLQECQKKTRDTREEFNFDSVITERNEDIIEGLMKFRFEPESHQVRRETKPEKKCESIKSFSKGKDIEDLQVCMVDQKTDLASVEECLIVDQKLAHFLQTFSRVQPTDRLERESQISCLESYSTFLCSSACRPCDSVGTCKKTCENFKDVCSLWPNSFGLGLSQPGLASQFQSEFWSPSPLRSVESEIDCSFFSNSTKKQESCSQVSSSLSELGWIYNVDSSYKKGKLTLSWEYGSRQSRSQDVSFTISLVETDSQDWAKVDVKSLPTQISTTSSSRLKFKVPEGKHTFSISASASSLARSLPSQSPITTQVTLEL